MPILRRGLPLAVAAAGARGAAPVVCEEKPLQRLLLRDGQQQVGREQATEEAVPLCALPAGLLRAPPLPGALPGAPEGPSGGGHSGLQGSRAAPVNVNVNVGGVTLKGDFASRVSGTVLSVWLKQPITSFHPHAGDKCHFIAAH